MKTTSAEVSGTPSEKVTPSRSVSVNTRPSGDAIHFSASHGSYSPVTRLRRTSEAWVSRVTASVAAWLPPGPSRLKVDGSLRRVAVSEPPRDGSGRRRASARARTIARRREQQQAEGETLTKLSAHS